MLSPDDARLVQADAAIPGLAVALDEARLAAWAAAGWPDLEVHGGVLDYVRYKPGTNCLTSGSLQTSNGPLPFTLKAYGDHLGAPLAKARRWSEARAGRRAPLVNLQDAVVMTTFPHDAKIASASRFTPAKLPRLMRQLGCAHTAGHQPTMSILSYRPERRLVARVDTAGRAQVVRAYSAPEFTRRTARFRWQARHLWSAAGSMATMHPTLPIWAAPFIEGTPLDRRLGHADRDEIVSVGAALARFHQGPTDGLSEGTVAAARRRLRMLGNGLAALLPDAAARLRAIAGRVADALPPAAGLACCHGDFGSRQVLLTPSGPCLIDLDEMAADDARVDIAAWLAELDYLVICGTLAADRATWASQAFLDGYRTVASVPSGLATARAAALLGLAPLPFRRRSTSWRTLTLSMLSDVERLLGPSTRTHAHRPTQSPGPSGVPMDDGLPWLARALDRTACVEELATLPALGPDVSVASAELLRHKPGRRAVIRYDVVAAGTARAVIGKMHHRGADRRGAAAQQALRHAGFDEREPHGIATPEVCGLLPNLGMWAQWNVDGTQATEWLSSPDAARVSERLADVALAIAARGPLTDRAHTIEAELAVLTQRLSWLASRRPARAERLARVLDRCHRLAGCLPVVALVPAHRDFYPDQVILAGSRAYVVDLDLYCLAPPGLDLGNCLAHIIERGLRERSTHADAAPAFASRAEAGLPPAVRPSLGMWTTLALARLIEIADRLPGRADAVEPLLDLVESRLERRVGLPEMHP